MISTIAQRVILFQREVVQDQGCVPPSIKNRQDSGQAGLTGSCILSIGSICQLWEQVVQESHAGIVVQTEFFVEPFVRFYLLLAGWRGSRGEELPSLPFMVRMPALRTRRLILSSFVWISLHAWSTSSRRATSPLMKLIWPSGFKARRSSMIWEALVSLLPTRYTRGETAYLTKARAVLSPMPLVPPTEGC